MDILSEGRGELLGWHDPDEARQWVLENKSRELKDKTMSVREVVSRFMHGGNSRIDELAVKYLGLPRCARRLMLPPNRLSIPNLPV